MASVTSQGPSPRHSPYDFDSTDDTDESWQYIDYSSGASATASVHFMPSPASGSLSGFAIIGHGSTPPQSDDASSLNVGQMDQHVFLPASTSYDMQAETVLSDVFAASGSDGFAPNEAFLTPQQYLFSQQDLNDFSQQDLSDLDPFMNTFETDAFPLMTQDDGTQTLQLNNVQPSQLNPNASSWGSVSPELLNANAISFEEFIPLPAERSPVSSSHTSSSPRSPGLKPEPTKGSPSNIRKVKTGKVEKKKVDQAGKFVIVTPTSINAHAGKPNPFECFEAMRTTTQKGRKGPLANETKQSALQVRRLGACFCCHSRKVKCDKERPCKHCKKLMVQVPQVVCWQFQDFLTALFPEFIRGHLKKDEVTKFVSNNIEGFAVNGVEQRCKVELFSGPSFSTTLSLEAKFFTAKSCEVLEHWHMTPVSNQLSLHANTSVPIGMEFSSNVQRDDARKKTKAYIQSIIQEPTYPEQLTDSFRSTQLPRKTLRIVQTFAQESDSPMVKRALSIYAMHYVMTRHLCITRNSVIALQPTGLVPQNVSWLTPRVLARQIKSIVDELIMREMQQLFDLFSKSLKPKARRDWAPCLAAFLVLCLYMEAVETTADTFAMSQNEINARNSSPPEYKRTFSLNICKEVENMPFKQFAYQFHNIYQTHTKDANTKSFNPLFDDSFKELGELDEAAVRMVESLKELFHGEDWQDIQFLADDAILLGRDENSFPSDPSFLYTGRLIAKFLLSFMNENAIFGSQI